MLQGGIITSMHGASTAQWLLLASKSMEQVRMSSFGVDDMSYCVVHVAPHNVGHAE